MSKYLDKGQAEIPTMASMNSKIFKDEMKKDLIEDMKNEVKIVNKYVDYSLKPIEINDIKNKIFHNS